MKDIDFDELDKAVSSVLGGASVKTDEVKVTQTTVAVAPDVAPVETPVSVRSESLEEKTILVQPSAQEAEKEEAPSVVPESPKIIASPAVRRGRFMDVVHPSSDMAPQGQVAPKPPVASAPSSRSITPVSSDLAPTASTPAAAATDAVIEQPLDSFQAEEPKLDTIDTPTNLDTSSVEDEESVSVEHTGVEADNDETEVDQAPSKTDTFDDKDPTDDEIEAIKAEDIPDAPSYSESGATPFLSDTKVDKRPLGAFAGEELADGDTPLPKELNSDVLDIESKEATEEPKAATQNVLISPENTADDAQLQHMFSAETAHHALPAGKKKSGAWLWILLIVALLAVGSGLGYLWFVNGY